MEISKIKKTSLICILVLTGSCSLLLFVFMLGRSLKIADVAYADKNMISNSKSATELPLLSEEEIPTFISRKTDIRDTVVFLLPANVHYEDLRFENNYLDKTFNIYIKSDAKSPYSAKEIFSNGFVEKADTYYFEAAGEVCVRLLFKDFYEYETEIEDEYILIRPVLPKKKYKKLLLIDPADAKKNTDAVCRLAQNIKADIESNTEDIRVYVLNSESTGYSADKIRDFVEKAGIDYYMAIQLPEGVGTARAETYFNDEYYISGYGNLSFAADIVQKIHETKEVSAGGVFSLKSLLEGENKLSDIAYLHISGQLEVIKNIKTTAAFLKIDCVNDASNDGKKRLADIAKAVSASIRDIVNDGASEVK